MTGVGGILGGVVGALWKQRPTASDTAAPGIDGCIAVNKESHSPSALTREELMALVTVMGDEIVALKARVAELERSQSLNSSNSSKPPSSDGLKKPKKPAKEKRTRSLRGKSKRKPGGQPGHPGKTLSQVADPNHIVDHYPTSCAFCGAPLTPEMGGRDYSARQVFDIPEPPKSEPSKSDPPASGPTHSEPPPPERPPLIVTEHRAHTCQCANCGARTRASFPEEVSAPVQYGHRTVAVVTYLYTHHLIPEVRLAELMADLHGVKIAASTVGRMTRAVAGRVQGFVDAVRDLVADAPVKHMDETSVRINGKNHWLHVACTEDLTHYRICKKRGDMLENVKKDTIVVHDHWKPYYGIPDVLHALCNAHHLREFKALTEIEKEDWAQKMGRLLQYACHAVNLAHERHEKDKTKPLELAPSLIGLINRRYDAIVAEGMAYHEALPALDPPVPSGGKKKRGRKKHRVGHNLAMRLTNFKGDTLRFLTDFAVPFTNNLPERKLRMPKAKQKISGGFRSVEGAEDFAANRSFIATCKDRGWKIIDALMQPPATLIQMLSTD